MVSVGVSKLGCTGLIFVEPGVKVNGAYYRNVLQHMLPDIRHIAGEFFIFQQDSAPAHRACEMILNTRHLISSRGFMAAEQPWPQSNRVNLGLDAQNDSTRRKCRTWTIWGSFWLTCGTEQNTALLVTPLTSGADVSVYVFRPKEDTLNIHCDLLISLTLNRAR